MRAFNAELSKLFSLPSIWLAFFIGIFGSAIIAILDSLGEKEDIIAGVSTRLSEIGYIGLAFGIPGVIIIGVIAVSSEYFTESSESGGGQQLTTSLTAVSSRIHFLFAKAGAVTVVSLLLSIIALFTTMGATYLTLGEYAPAIEISRYIGVICNWIFTALLAFGITVLTKNGIIPLTILILNASVVTVSYLLSNITKLGFYLPDSAGRDMFMGDGYFSPFVGGLIMFTWVAVLFIVAAIVFYRRDVAS